MSVAGRAAVWRSTISGPPAFRFSSKVNAPRWGDFGWRVLNFIIFAGILWYFVGGLARKFFSGRRARISQDLQDLEARRAEAQKRLDASEKAYKDAQAKKDAAENAQKEKQQEYDRLQTELKSAETKLLLSGPRSHFTLEVLNSLTGLEAVGP